MSRSPSDVKIESPKDEWPAPNAPRVAHSHALGAVRIATTVLATIATLWALQWGSVFIIPCVVAICMTFWLMPLVDRLERWRIPRSLGAALVLVGLAGGIGSIGYSLRDDAHDFAATLPVAAHHVREIVDEAARDPNGWIYHARSVLSDRTPIQRKTNPAQSAAQDSADLQAAVVKGSTTLIEALGTFGVVMFTIYLMLTSGDLFKRKLMVVISSRAQAGTMTRKRITIEILNEIESQFQRYLGVLAGTNVVIGFLTWGAFSALGVKNAAVWGAAAAILHIVPYVGPAAIALASFVVTASQFDSLSQAFIVASVAVAIFAIIGMLVQTWLAGRASRMNAVAVFIGLIFWGWLWGIPGLLLGTPLMMATKVIAERVDCLDWLGTFLGDAPKAERKSALRRAMENRKSEPVTSAPGAALTESAAMGETIAAEVAAETPTVARNSVAEELGEQELVEAEDDSKKHRGEFAAAPAAI